MIFKCNVAKITGESPPLISKLYVGDIHVITKTFLSFFFVGGAGSKIKSHLDICLLLGRT